MAVYTKISKDELNDFLKNYEIGKITKFFGIKEVIDNTNYQVQTKKNKFILTIYEKRVEAKDLPFFKNLQKNLVKNGLDCPLPIENENGSLINNIAGKPAAVLLGDALRGRPSSIGVVASGVTLTSQNNESGISK